MPWPATPPTSVVIITPLPQKNAVYVGQQKIPDVSLYTAADSTPRTETHRVCNGRCSTNPAIKAEQETAVDAQLTAHAPVEHPHWCITPEGVGIGKYPLSGGPPNPYNDMLAAMELTTSAV